MQPDLTFAFAAGDIGGARALLPVARLAASRGYTVHAMRHGTLWSEGDADWVWFEPPGFAEYEFWDNRRHVLCYATSVADTAAVTAALAARSAKVPILHVLDNWSSYSARLHAPDGRTCVPDAYAVMDELAQSEAVADGVPASILRITGHPDLAKLSLEAAVLSAPTDSGPLRVLFVSEPASADSGGRAAENWRGYDEAEVSAIVGLALAEAARELPVDIDLHVVPHPREAIDTVAERWLASPGRLAGQIVDRKDVRARLFDSHVVVGMSSILLYEAWLLGKPTMSVQPNLRQGLLRSLSRRHGLEFCTDAALVKPKLFSMLAGVRRAQPAPTSAMQLHALAPQNVFDLAIELAGKGSGAQTVQDVT